MVVDYDVRTDPTDSDEYRNAVTNLQRLLQQAEEHHASYEATAPQHDWSAWYAAYMQSRSLGRTSAEASSDASRFMDAILRAD